MRATVARSEASTTGRNTPPPAGAGKTTQFDYSADEDRLVRRDVDVSTLHFVSDLYQRKFDTFDTTLEERFRLYAGDRQIGEIVRKDGTDKTLYFHTDHLGSTDTISDSTGAATTQHFEPFGAPIAPPNPEITRVGFTGQDQDVDLGFTDMKGRMYDPLAGRFASADPVMQAPFWSQGLNSYSYVFNDPINNTDPSGFESTAAWLASAAFTAVDVGLLCYGTGCGVGITGALSSGSDLGTTWFGGFPGAASPGRTYSGVAPTAAPTGGGTSPSSTPATGQIKPTGIPKADLSVPEPWRGSDERLAQNFQPGGYCHEDGPCNDSTCLPLPSGARSDIVEVFDEVANTARQVAEAARALWRWVRSLPAPKPVPRLPAPSTPGGMPLGKFGKTMGWGTGNAAARARIETVTAEEMAGKGVTREMAENWGKFYENEALRNPANPSAADARI